LALLTPSVVVEEGERETVRGRGREQETRERRDRAEESRISLLDPKKNPRLARAQWGAPVKPQLAARPRDP